MIPSVPIDAGGRSVTYRPDVSRFLLALATLLVLAGCTSGSTQNSAESSSSAPTSSSTAAQRSGSAAGTTTALPSAPSVAPNGAVSKTTYAGAGGVWPLTVTDGALSCQFGTQVVFTTSKGDVYGLNAAARADTEWNDISPLRADDPKHPGHKLSLDDLIASGHALC